MGDDIIWVFMDYCSYANGACARYVCYDPIIIFKLVVGPTWTNYVSFPNVTSKKNLIDEILLMKNKKGLEVMCPNTYISYIVIEV